MSNFVRRIPILLNQGAKDTVSPLKSAGLNVSPLDDFWLETPQNAFLIVGQGEFELEFNVYKDATLSAYEFIEESAQWALCGEASVKEGDTKQASLNITKPDTWYFIDIEKGLLDGHVNLTEELEVEVR